MCCGGVGLNCVANRKLLDRTPFEQIYLPPAPHDGGLAVGLALYLYHAVLNGERTNSLVTATHGKMYTDAEIRSALHDYKLDGQQYPEAMIPEEAARLIARGAIVGWFQGKSEWGPRALGSRSIVCDPRSTTMKALLNGRVKHREAFRPFAPSVLADQVQQYFDLAHPSPFMLMIANTYKNRIPEIPAVLHVDGTARLQTVTPEANEKYYRLIEAFYQITGVPLVLNTSFNDQEPIVETPGDALRCFTSTKMDYLVLNNTILRKA